MNILFNTRKEFFDFSKSIRALKNPDETWAIPDPENEAHIASLRRNSLLQLFRAYATEKGKLASFRKEAVIEGFKHCWQTKQYGVIVRVCERMRPADLQADSDLLQFYDIAKDLAAAQGDAPDEYVPA